MQKQIQLRLEPRAAFTEQLLKDEIRKELSLNPNDTLSILLKKRSIDARGKKIWINLSLSAFVNEIPPQEVFQPGYADVSGAVKTCHIIGAGPAGLFSALKCIELGIKPVLIERGKDVRERRRDLAAINKYQIVNPESNYCFGEGGAGTYSDGKLYTRSSKRGDIEKILKILVLHGASEEVLVDSHPHIGTNKLPQLIQNIRQTILKYGGQIHFNTRLDDIEIKNGKITGLQANTLGGDPKNSSSEKKIYFDQIQSVVLATGHSARDIYSLLYTKNILLEAKPFALGVRVEHEQSLIDSIQYHCGSFNEVNEKRTFLPAASYSLVHQTGTRGVYSFCMCPGGIIAPCATRQGEIVTNGWSPSKRNNLFANSGIVVGLDLRDYGPYEKHGALAGLEFQKHFEKIAWEKGGNTSKEAGQVAPAQRLLDFVNGKLSADIPKSSYQPGLKSANMQEVLGSLIGPALQTSFKAFGSKMRGYLNNEAVVVGVESRTSTPVRIPRHKEMLNHPQITNLFPCGEGAGYAGGIMSAAMDGELCAVAVSKMTQ